MNKTLINVKIVFKAIYSLYGSGIIVILQKGYFDLKFFIPSTKPFWQCEWWVEVVSCNPEERYLLSSVCMCLRMFAWQVHVFFSFVSFWNSTLTFTWSFSSSFVLLAISSSPKWMAVICALYLTAAHEWCYAFIIFSNDYNCNLTIRPPTFFPPCLSVFLPLSLNLFMEWNSKLTKFQMAMAKASEQSDKLGKKTHQCLNLHFHLIFFWPVALCTESIFLTPFPIYYWETAGRKGKYWLECSLCLLTDCALHKNSNEIAVCFLFPVS